MQHLGVEGLGVSALPSRRVHPSAGSSCRETIRLWISIRQSIFRSAARRRKACAERHVIGAAPVIQKWVGLNRGRSFALWALFDECGRRGREQAGSNAGSELLIMSMQAAATRTEKRHRLMAYPDRCRPPGRTTCLRPRISFALLF